MNIHTNPVTGTSDIATGTDTGNTNTSVLNNLIETLKDGQLGFQAAAEDATRSDLKQLFQQYSDQRAEFARQLQAVVGRSGDTAEESGSLSAALHRGWINLKAAVVNRDNLAVLEECERGEDVAVGAYRDALKDENLGAARTIVSQQYEQIQATHDHVRALRDNFDTNAATA